MSKSWNEQELKAASAAMKASGNLSYEEFCAELEKHNNFDADYQEEAMDLMAYETAEEASDELGMAAARDSHNAHMAKIEAKGKTYCRIFREYMQSMESENDYLDINDTVWDRDVADLINCMRENGIEHFTFSSTWSGAVETAWLFTLNGCQLQGLVEINGRCKDFMTDEYERVHAYLFSID